MYRFILISLVTTLLALIAFDHYRRKDTAEYQSQTQPDTHGTGGDGHNGGDNMTYTHGTNHANF